VHSVFLKTFSVLAIIFIFVGNVYAGEDAAATIAEAAEAVDSNANSVTVAGLEKLKADLTALIDIQQDNANHIWTMVCMALVFLMQGGFLLLEAGMVRSKNSISVAQKNIVDFLIAMAAFYMFGFSLMFGESVGGLIGWSSDLFMFSQSGDWNYTFFLFQAVFAGTAGTIVSGAIAERMKFMGYIWITIIIACVIYPVIGHWAWGNLLNGDNETFLTKAGFIDFAGSTVVHSVGAWVALAAVIILGPRTGRFDEKGKAQRMEGHSLVLSTLGCIILWVGWIGFNGGSTTTGNSGFAHIIFNTMISATFGGCVAVAIGYFHEGFFRPDRAINGILGGLVGITAGCDVVTGHGAMLIGIFCGFIGYYTAIFMVRHMKIDDVVGAIPVHGVCGAVGTIMVGFLVIPEKMAAASMWDQVFVQVQGVVVTFIWAFGVSYAAIKILDSVIGIRIPVEDEIEGLNLSEHKTMLGTAGLQMRLKDIVEGTKDLTKRVPTDSGDESAEIAIYFNEFIQQMQDLMGEISMEAGILNDSSEKLSYVSTVLASGSEVISTQSDTVADSSLDVSKDVSDIAKLIADMSKEVTGISGNASLMSDNMESVSKVVTELTGSVRNVAKESENASVITDEAQKLADNASVTVQTLGEASTKIGDVVGMIKRIAEQTNLLALNATIEASRAGEAGRGFAVVAAEVKTLAEETSKATEEISARISDIQGNTESTSTVMDKISSIMDTINKSIGSIKDSTNIQNQAADQISSSVVQATSSASDIAGSISEVAKNSEIISNKATHAAETSREVSKSVEGFSQEASSSSKNVQTVSGTSDEMVEMADRLGNAVKAYKT